MLIFIGLGLYDEKDISLKALEEARSCDILYAEFYTSKLTGTSLEGLEELIGQKIVSLLRSEVESSEKILESAKNRKVGFLVPGDPLVSTTHASLRIEAKEKGIETRVIHGQSIISAAPAISGLFNYKFGKSTSIPYPTEGYEPDSFYTVIKENLDHNLHTLVFLDIKNRLMTVNEAISILEGIEKNRMEDVIKDERIFVGLGCVGSSNPVIIAGKLAVFKNNDFGPTPHVLIVPGKLHFMEEEYLKEFGGL